MRLIYDIGCNKGDFTDCYADTCRVISVEADKRTYLKCKDRFVNNPNVTVINRLVSSVSNKETDFWQCNWSVASSASKDWVFNGRFSGKKDWSKVKVESITLDDLIDTYGVPDLIKIDVEGFELEVLKGLSGKAGIIAFEWSEEIWHKTIKCIEHLKSIGYTKFDYQYRDKPFKTDYNWQDFNKLEIDIKPERKHNWGMLFSI